MNENKSKAAKSTDKDIISALFSSAALLGDALFYFGKILNLTFDGYEESEASAETADREWLSEFGQLKNPENIQQLCSMVKESESPGDQTIQVLTLLHPHVRRVFDGSAIYGIFSEALRCMGQKGSNLEEQIDGLNLVALSGLWIISKRVFVLRHREDCLSMVQALVSMSEGEPVEHLNLTAATKSDMENVGVFYYTYFSSTAFPGKEKTPEEALREITEIQSTDNIALMSSKVSRNIIKIASGAGIATTNVGKEGSAPVIVRATIGDRNGNQSVKLDRTDYVVMEAVGQIVQENGKGIIITPSQIYRKIAFANSSFRPSDQTIDEIVASMDKLLYTPASIDFAEQIEKHTKLKAKNKDIRDNKIKAAIEGNIISGLHLKRFSTAYKGQAVEHSFMIYDMPMFYYYAQAVKNIVTIPGYLLSGSTPRNETAPKKAQKQQKTTPQRIGLTELGLRRYLLERIEYCKKLKQKTAEINRKKGIQKDEYVYRFAFSTIAEEVGYSIDTPKRQRMLREQTYEFMQEQAEKKNIKRCNYYYKGRALSGIELFL